MTEIQRFYQQKTVFITGGTGFIGKIMIEKLLRLLLSFTQLNRKFDSRCTDIARIYLLIREKKGVEPRERLETLFTTKLFDRLREEKASFQTRVIPLEGDIEKPMLGLSLEDQTTLIDKVDIFFSDELYPLSLP